MTDCYLLIVDRDSQEHKDVLGILKENEFYIQSPPHNCLRAFDMVAFIIYKHNKRAVVNFVGCENFDLWRGYIYNFITFNKFKHIFERIKPTLKLKMASLSTHDNC